MNKIKATLIKVKIKLVCDAKGARNGPVFAAECDDATRMARATGRGSVPGESVTKLSPAQLCEDRRDF